jgi:2-haloacid dehalogenase
MTLGTGGPAEDTSAVLLDIGGVLLDWDPRYLYRKLFGDDEVAMEAFLANICSPAWHAEQDRGKSVAVACAELSAEHPGHAELINAWAERGEEMIGGVLEGSVEVLGELKAAGVPCYALSNMEVERWEERLEAYDFLRWFDGGFISGREGVAKPDHEYFERALERFGLAPGEVVFVDDRAENTGAAEALGIPTVLFRSPEGLRARLAAMGLLAQGRGYPVEDLVEDAGGGGEVEPGEPGASGAEVAAGAEHDPGVGR